MGCDSKLSTEVCVVRRQHFDQVEVFHAIVAHQNFTSRPNVIREVVMEEQWEGFLLSELTIEVAVEVVNFGLHAAVGFEEEIGVATEQIPQVHLGQVRRMLLDQVKLFDNHFLSVLEGHLRVMVKHVQDMTSFHILMDSEVVKKSNHCLCLAAKQSTTFNALIKSTKGQCKQINQALRGDLPRP